MKLKVNHDVIHATDADTIAKLKKTIAGLKGENTKLSHWIDVLDAKISQLTDTNECLREINREELNKNESLQRQICNREDKQKFNYELKEKELLNIIKKQANYIINHLNK